MESLGIFTAFIALVPGYDPLLPALKGILDRAAPAWGVKSVSKLLYVFSLHHHSGFLVFLLSLEIVIVIN